MALSFLFSRRSWAEAQSTSDTPPHPDAPDLCPRLPQEKGEAVMYDGTWRDADPDVVRGSSRCVGTPCALALLLVGPNVSVKPSRRRTEGSRRW